MIGKIIRKRHPRPSPNRNPNVDYTCYDGYEYLVEMCGVYTIECRANGQVLVGSSKNVENRWVRHQTALLNRLHTNHHLTACFEKYGLDGLEFSVVELCPRITRKKVEQGWIECVPKELCMNEVLAWNEGDGDPDLNNMETRIRKSRARGGRPIIGVEILTGTLKRWEFQSLAELEMGFNRKNIKMVLNGAASHHKGWFFLSRR